MNMQGTANRKVGTQARDKYQTILSENPHYVGVGFKRDPNQLKRIKKARKGAKKETQLDALSQMEYVQRKGGGGLRKKTAQVQPNLSPPKTVLG